MIGDTLVSVIVSTYRRDYDLNRALQSVISQSYKNIEIVIVDDNADKNWNEKVETIIDGLNDARIKLVTNSTNIGSARSRNVGIEVAKGEYITFLDDDDEYLYEKIEKQVEHVINNNADYCITDLDLFYENGALSEHRIRWYIIDTDTNSLMRYHLLYHMTGTDTMMFKREYLLKIGMFPPIDVGDEYYLMMEAIKNNGKFSYLNRCDVRAVVHSSTDGLSSGEKKIQGENALYEIKKNYFPDLSRKDVRYIKVRHHLVVAFAQFRRKYYISMLKHGLCATIISPIDTLRIIGRRA